MTRPRFASILGIPAAIWGVLALGLAAVGLLVALDRFQLAAWDYEARLQRSAGQARRLIGAARRAEAGSAGRAQALRRAASALDTLIGHSGAAARDEGDSDDLVLQQRAKALSGRLLAPVADGSENAWLEEIDTAAGRLEELVDRHTTEHRERARSQLQLAVAAWIAALGLAVLALLWRERRRREAEAALEESRRRLAHARKMEAVGRLAGGIAHDINNHLAAIMSQCELVQRKEMPRERVLERAAVVSETVLKASSLVERLLAFGRRQPSRPEPVDLNEVVEALSRVLAGSLPAGVELDTHLAPDLPPVIVDLSQMEQILANLFVNARDAISGRGRITISTARGGTEARPQALLTVTDTGCGIPPENRERIFDPFFTTKAGRGSSGLGLATVYALTEEAAGRIDVESRPGAGSSFTVTLPGASGPSVRRTVAGPRDLRGSESILLVDDNVDLAAAAGDHLAGLGYRVRVAASAGEALSLATAESFDLVVSDLRLTDGSGPEMVAELRRHRPLRALYMSGYADRIAWRASSQRGEAFFIKKPFSLAGFAGAVRELLDEPFEVRSTA